MWTARHAFTHQISTEKRKEHGLVNWGVYAYVRHPGRWWVREERGGCAVGIWTKKRSAYRLISGGLYWW